MRKRSFSSRRDGGQCASVRLVVMLVCCMLLQLTWPVGSRAGQDEAALASSVLNLCRQYLQGFGSTTTDLVYHHRLDGPQGAGVLSSPDEIRAGTVRGQPMPYGYGSGIQDVALENGQFLYALCEVFDTTGDEEAGRMARRIFQGLRRVATLSPVPGFVPRGPHVDGKSYYRDSSRDQHAALAEALWRYGCSSLATVDERRFVAEELDAMARRMESNDWKIMVEDGSHMAHVGFGWTQHTSIGAISLLSFLALVADATGHAHWREQYEQYSREADAVRWRLLAPDQIAPWKPLTLYSNQFAQSLQVLKRAQDDPQHRRQVTELMTGLAKRSLETNVFDPRCWRRLDWSGSELDQVATQRLAPLGLSLSTPLLVPQLFEQFDSRWMRSDDAQQRSVGSKLCFGIPTVAFHMALLSQDSAHVAAVAPAVRKMMRIMLEHGAAYDRGENFNRAVVLGLLLWAAEAEAAAVEQGYRPLDRVQSLGLGPAMDVEYDRGKVYVVGEGSLRWSDTQAANGGAAAQRTVMGLGHVRQLCVQDDVAYVTAREDGLFVVDVARQQVLAHYDTIELATGIAVAGDIAFVACRTAGVELVDVSQPQAPRHLSTIRTGEAQSLCVQGSILYAGVWGAGELVVCDVADCYAPAVLARAKLKGYGDGVAVRGDYAFIATGHHRKGQRAAQPEDPGYGQGHGLEIFNVRDPRHPEFVSRVEFPQLYRLGMDMWDVRVAGDRAYVADTYNGVFVVDISQLRTPRVVARYQLPFVERRADPSPAAGVSIGNGCVYVAGAWSDVHRFVCDTSPSPLDARPLEPLSVGPPPRPTDDPQFHVYRPRGQVHAVSVDGQIAWVACGGAGVHAIDAAGPGRVLRTYATRGFALDVASSDNRVYVAAGEEGLTIWKHQGAGQLVPLGKYEVPNDSVRQVVVVEDRYALLHVGASTLQVIDVRDPAHPRRLLEDSRLGLFYYHPLAPGLLAGRYASCHWHVSGLYWYDLSGATPRYAGVHQALRIGSRNGVAYRGSQLLLTCRGGYSWTSLDQRGSLEDLTVHRVADGPVHGKPTLEGNRLFVSDRYTGIVTALDVSDDKRPQLLGQLQLSEHPGLVVVSGQTPIIPGGYQGLIWWDAFTQQR